MADKAGSKIATDKISIDDEFEALFRTPLDSLRTVLERTWFRNILYYMGEQWLSWFQEQGTFGRRYELNVSIPTPVSNIIRDYVRSMKALTLNKRYSTTIWPNSEDQEDKDAAMMGVHLLDWMDSLNDNEIEDIKELIELWRMLTGNGFARTYSSLDDGQYTVSKTGGLIIRKGSVITECLIPFNLMVPHAGMILRDKRLIGIKSLKSREWVEDTFNTKLKGTEGKGEVDYQMQLMTLVANVAPWKGRGFESDLAVTNAEDLVIFKEIEWKPTSDHPKGRYAAYCEGETLIDDDKMPIPVGKNGEWDYSVTHFRYDSTPGGFWCMGGVDDLISPQNTINRIDQALEMNRDSLGRPFVLTPAEVVMKRLSSRNQGILSIVYNGRDTMGAKPAIHPGTPYPGQILEEREIQRSVAQDASGDPKNILKGQSPGSGASGIMVDILRATAELGHAPDVTRFYRSWNRVNRKRIILAQKLFTESRLIKIRGAGNTIEVKKFKGSDLRNNTDVRLELDSGVSSTHVGRNQFIMQLIKEQFWGDIATKPQVQRELMKRFGMGGFPEEDNIHRDRAEVENSKLAAGVIENIAFPGIPDGIAQGATGEAVPESWVLKPVIDAVFRVDNHLIHMQVHDQFILSRQFYELSEEKQAYAIGHRVMHEEAWKAQEMEQMAREAQAAEQTASGEQSSGTGQPKVTTGGEAAV